MAHNARQLQPVTLVPSGHLSLYIDSNQYHKGWQEGLCNTQEHPRFDIRGCPSEAGIVEIVRNLTELAVEGILSEDVLLHDCGLISGWLLRHDVLINQTEMRHV